MMTLKPCNSRRIRPCQVKLKVGLVPVPELVLLAYPDRKFVVERLTAKELEVTKGNFVDVGAPRPPAWTDGRRSLVLVLC